MKARFKKKSKKILFGIGAIGVCFLGPIFAFANESDALSDGTYSPYESEYLVEESENSTISVTGTIDLETKKGSISFDDYCFSMDESGSPILVAFFEFTNTSGEKTSAYDLFSCSAVQKTLQGTESLEYALEENPDYIEYLVNCISGLKNGDKVKLAVPFYLKDYYHPVVLTVSESDTEDSDQSQELSIDIASEYKTINQNSVCYEFEDGSQYAFENASPKENGFFYGKDALGVFSISGDIGIETTYKDVPAYEANSSLFFNYSYNGDYLDSSNKEKWYLDDSHDLIVNGIKTNIGLLPQDRINTGVIIVEKSKNGKKWEQTGEIYNDFFDENQKGKDAFYISTKEETINGMYYRVIVAYQLKRRIKEGDIFSPEEFEYKECVELYEFYICANENPVRIHDLISRDDITSSEQAQAVEGFYIDRNWSENSIIVSRDSDQYVYEKNLPSYTEKGEYTVTIATKIGREYQQEVRVTEGIDYTEVPSKVYSSEEDSGFSTKREYYDKTSSPVSSLKIGVPPDSKLSQKGNNYSVLSSSVSLFMSLSDHDLKANGWSIITDDWGKKESQKVGGIHLGQIGKGAVLVQTSEDGKNWKHADKAGYADGFENTDVIKNYGIDKDFMLYTPAGDAVQRGVYIRILFAYQIRQKETEEIQDRVDKYSFYLCSNDLSTVTVHNLSVQDNLKEYLGELDETTLEVYRSAENMNSGSGTVTGFSVDTSNNLSADYSVKKNGKDVPKQDEYTETGRYDVTISNNAGDMESRTIYVDRLSAEESLKLYFGDSFIQGKRIYYEGDYPMYEGGESSYYLAEVSDQFLPIMGKIINKTTGEIIELSYSRAERTGELETAGEYEAVFYTQDLGDEVLNEKTESSDVIEETERLENTENTNNLSGDVKIFSFHFVIIPNGTAPGPVVNKRNLEDYNRQAITDCYPIYYYVKRTSASKGDIRIAFSNEEDAFNYSYNYEKGTVETQADGTFRYRGPFEDVEKESYTSEMELQNAINDFSRRAVTRAYLNISDPFTCRMLDPDLKEDIKNLQAEKLSASIIVFDGDQMDLLTQKQKDALPIINDKKFAYLNPMKDPQTFETTKGFEFIRDQHGYDSEKVTIIDSAGKDIPIEYKKNVESQLIAANCETGIITVKEETCFGDTTSYEAAFFNKGDNTATITLSCTEGNEEKKIKVDQEHSNKTKLVADSFSIDSVEDKLDPYDLIIVKWNGKVQSFFCSDDIFSPKYIVPGMYNIRVINRMGYDYSFNVEIPEKEGQPEQVGKSVGKMDTVNEIQTESESSTQLSEKENNRQEIEQEKKEGNALPIVIVIIFVALACVIGIVIFRKKTR